MENLEPTYVGRKREEREEKNEPEPPPVETMTAVMVGS